MNKKQNNNDKDTLWVIFWREFICLLTAMIPVIIYNYNALKDSGCIKVKILLKNIIMDNSLLLICLSLLSVNLASIIITNVRKKDSLTLRGFKFLIFGLICFIYNNSSGNYNLIIVSITLIIMALDGIYVYYKTKK